MKCDTQNVLLPPPFRTAPCKTPVILINRLIMAEAGEWLAKHPEYIPDPLPKCPATPPLPCHSTVANEIQVRQMFIQIHIDRLLALCRHQSVSGILYGIGFVTWM